MTKTETQILLNYLPHNAQIPFHKDRYKIRNRGLIGGGGTGKTEAGAWELLD